MKGSIHEGIVGNLRLRVRRQAVRGESQSYEKLRPFRMGQAAFKDEDRVANGTVKTFEGP